MRYFCKRRYISSDEFLFPHLPVNTSLSILSFLTLSSFDFPRFKCSGSPSSNCYFIFLEAFQFKVIVVCKSRHINYLPYACIISWLPLFIMNSVYVNRTRSLFPPDGKCASLHFLCLVCDYLEIYNNGKFIKTVTSVAHSNYKAVMEYI